jgi:hypothetical protein
MRKNQAGFAELERRLSTPHRSENWSPRRSGPQHDDVKDRNRNKQGEDLHVERLKAKDSATKPKVAVTVN